ncbi:hypothetical protein HY410_00215 [Candidatus Gottesmanbacteria bacterium]|nr:hypothetical protein [Candidatus Gottesmanbacteria bacterium]
MVDPEKKKTTDENDPQIIQEITDPDAYMYRETPSTTQSPKVLRDRAVARDLDKQVNQPQNKN